MKFENSTRFDAISEKDIDMLLLEEFWCNVQWRQWFYEQLRMRRTDLPRLDNIQVVAGRSVSGLGTDGKAGETDVLVVYSDEVQADARVVVLIEDKISASFTKDQPSRYGTRAAAESVRHACTHHAIVLVAPQRYLITCPEASFDLILPLEHVLDFLREHADAAEGELRLRVLHSALMLEHVCGDRHRYSKGVIYHESNTVAITSIEDYVRQTAPQLLVKPGKARGSGSYGPGFDLPAKSRLRQAARERGIEVNTARAELNFNWFLAEGKIRIRFHCWQGLVTELHNWFSIRAPAEIHVKLAPSGKSVDLVRDGFPKFEMAGDLESQRELVDQWIAGAVIVQNWFEGIASELEEMLRSPQ